MQIGNSKSSTTLLASATHQLIMVATMVLLFASLHLTSATEYSVGDSDGWTIGPSYLAWSQKYNFSAGDTLVFNYVQSQHNVYRVTRDAFRTCDPANQTMGVWASGQDFVNLTTPGDYYFLCNVNGHCLGGMKFSIAVGAPLPPPPSPPPPTDMPTPRPPPPTSSVGSGRLAWPDFARLSWLLVIGLSVNLL